MSGLDGEKLDGIIQPGQEGAGLDDIAFLDADFADGAGRAEFEADFVGHIEVAVGRDGEDEVAPVDGRHLRGQDFLRLLGTGSEQEGQQ